MLSLTSLRFFEFGIRIRSVSWIQGGLRNFIRKPFATYTRVCDALADPVPFDLELPGTSNAWLAAITGRYKLVLSTADVPWLIDVDEDPKKPKPDGHQSAGLGLLVCGKLLMSS